MNRSRTGSDNNIYEHAGQADFWRQLNPGLTIGERPFAASLEEYPIGEDELAEHLRQYKKEGYFQTRPLIPEADVKRLADGIKTVVGRGFPPAFAFVYDEFWQLYRKLSQVLTPLFGENYKITANIWAWYVRPHENSAGFKPHRDFTGIDTVRDDGLPMMGTIWIPLSDVSTLSSCMYILPSNLDPCVPHNLSEHNVGYGDLQSVRALPAKAGSVLGWTTRTLHWGSRSSEFCKEPRISIATYMERRDETRFNGFLLNPPLHLPLEHRLALLAQVIRNYNEEPLSYDRFPKPLLQFCEKYVALLPEVNKQACST